MAGRGKPPRDITGQRFGKLTALRRLPEKWGNNSIWECRCDCGNITRTTLGALTTGNTRSCGCGRYTAPKKSGARGINWNKLKQRWQVVLWENKKRILLGSYRELEDAKAAKAKYIRQREEED